VEKDSTLLYSKVIFKFLVDQSWSMQQLFKRIIKINIIRGTITPQFAVGIFGKWGNLAGYSSLDDCPAMSALL
jgi:hypothetical protein